MNKKSLGQIAFEKHLSVIVVGEIGYKWEDVPNKQKEAWESVALELYMMGFSKGREYSEEDNIFDQEQYESMKKENANE